MSEPSARNRAHWDAKSDDYQATHGAFIGGPEPGWGAWQFPESELRVLGDVAGKDVLELGCGAAQWSIALTRRGARAVGLDVSERQLEHARRLMAEAGVEFPLVHSGAEAVPLADGSFDVVFCDHGAMSFADPYLTVPEAARLLRPGGLLAFSIGSPLHEVCWSEAEEKVTGSLQQSYFDLHRWEDPDGSVGFNLPYGEWIRLFRRHSLVIEDLLEPRPREGAASTYGWDLDWARRWPAECIWKARKTWA